MKKFLDDDFLLTTPAARTLYRDYAENRPVFDFHNHLDPRDIACHRRFRNLTELWLEGDHYKWRAMRALGTDEYFITGGAPPREKFDAWARVLPLLAGSPLSHWTHLELRRYFGITEPLCPGSAERIWKRTEEMLREDGFDTVSLLKRMNVRVLCTTDDPADSLEWHRKIASDPEIPFKVLPTFRPDRFIGRADEDAAAALKEKFGKKTLHAALEAAFDFFLDMGCVVSDLSVEKFPYGTDPALTEDLRFFGTACEERGVVMQLHFGALRNVSPRLKKLIGLNAGCDSIGAVTDPAALGAFLGDLEGTGHLPRTILYNLNPAENAVFSSMAGNFAPKVQHGAAWWFNDHLRGIGALLDELMEGGSLASSVGMLTDSRSFTSFVRHEYFRRILCEKLGQLADGGLYPSGMETLGQIVKNVCYDNAAGFFSGQR